MLRVVFMKNNLFPLWKEQHELTHAPQDPKPYFLLRNPLSRSSDSSGMPSLASFASSAHCSFSRDCHVSGCRNLLSSCETNSLSSSLTILPSSSKMILLPFLSPKINLNVFRYLYALMYWIAGSIADDEMKHFHHKHEFGGGEKKYLRFFTYGLKPRFT